MKTYRYTINGKTYKVAVNSVFEGIADVVVNGKSYKVELGTLNGRSVYAPLPGRVVSVNIAVGDDVKEGQVIAVLETMKMENEILSEFDGKVVEICVGEGDTVAAGGELVVIE